MEKIKTIFILFLTINIFCACNDGEKDKGEVVQINSSNVYIEGMENLSRVSINGYSVNTNADPTRTLNGREDWVLDVAIFYGDTEYIFGASAFSWDNLNNYWIPDYDIYFPNYKKQKVRATLQPDSWTGIQENQSATNGSGLLLQDVLKQNSIEPENTVIILPAHRLEIEMKHAHSMLDFRIIDVDETHINNVIVTVGTIDYIPYKVPNTQYPEYMVIIPAGSVTPTVKLTTNDGIIYMQTTEKGIASTEVNTCYCFTLRGYELRLSEITIETWSTGQGISGDYTIESSYPTFRGTPNALVTIYYDNGLEQSLIFNDQGESTEKPAGRSIIRIQSEFNRYDFDPPIILTGMIIDITAYTS